jgi:hypothetical protein
MEADGGDVDQAGEDSLSVPVVMSVAADRQKGAVATRRKRLLGSGLSPSRLDNFIAFAEPAM